MDDALKAGEAMAARIFKPTKTAMQSGVARTKNWVLEYEPESPREIDPLMGWTSSSDMKSQVRLAFPSQDEAVAYAKKNGIPFQVMQPHKRKLSHRTYSDNFKFGRVGSWTH